MNPPVVAVSIGCPAGVGPEVAVAAAARCKEARCVLVGDEAVIHRAAELRRVSSKRLIRITAPLQAERLPPGKIGVFYPTTRLRTPTPFGEPDAEAGAAQLGGAPASAATRSTSPLASRPRRS
jgi:4-hydroxythreonine-4-phosphate dehydrogenase